LTCFSKGVGMGCKVCQEKERIENKLKMVKEDFGNVALVFGVNL